jgi:hypothetical protein
MRQRETCVGAKLARESSVSGNNNVDCAAVFAGKLAPTVTVALPLEMMILPWRAL